MSKYGARKTVIDGIEFDSRKEARYYTELKLLKKAGEIVDFELQPEYILQPAFRKNGKTYRPITYRADFLVTHKDGRKEVVDVKGYKTAVYDLKKKLFENRYPDLTIKEA